ncbi:hypothetical protein GE061_009944 [Apolygus lucorum]|uniref:Uncharacterized protein n=1 Tax=Apolygus lucorum TaxID=248454 RepID=A0A6A4KI19_APOLU|nr:hypothetical protein GE061_009944 [Apolygus lucorum]
MSSFSERKYIDPWDVENYIYLRKGPTSSRRRSVCFDQAVKYASYQDDGYGPIYGSLVETNLKPSGPDYPEDRSLYIYNSAHSLQSPSHCPSCFRDLNEIDDYGMATDAIYEDLLARCQLMERRKRRKKASLMIGAEPKYEMNTFGHLRIDYSGNWNYLDRIIGSA